jgi:hypothetical protein
METNCEHDLRKARDAFERTKASRDRNRAAVKRGLAWAHGMIAGLGDRRSTPLYRTDIHELIRALQAR